MPWAAVAAAVPGPARSAVGRSAGSARHPRAAMTGGTLTAGTLTAGTVTTLALAALAACTAAGVATGVVRSARGRRDRGPCADREHREHGAGQDDRERQTWRTSPTTDCSMCHHFPQGVLAYRNVRCGHALVTGR